jgi:hypothetical protein
MSNWKEQIEESGYSDSALINKQRITPEVLRQFISTEIIEKLIDDIPGYLNLKQQLRTKWL